MYWKCEQDTTASVKTDAEAFFPLNNFWLKAQGVH